MSSDMYAPSPSPSPASSLSEAASDRALAAPASSPLRSAWVRAGLRIEGISLAWMVVEAVVALSAGVLAHSVLLASFGLDSLLELVTGGVLLWRLSVEARGGARARVERVEHRAAWVTGIGLALLCVYIVGSAAIGFFAGIHAETSLLGIVLAVLALLIMPVLAWRKRVLATKIGSAALRGDAACSITCAYLAGALLAGLTLTAAFGWWWADSVAALALLYWLVPEAREALEGARAGRGGCGCGEACDEATGVQRALTGSASRSATRAATAQKFPSWPTRIPACRHPRPQPPLVRRATL